MLHDMFNLPFGEIAPIVGRSAVAARQLASRARRRVRGTNNLPDADLTDQRRVVDAFLAASRSGDFEALLAVLDPDIVRADRAAVPAGGPRVVRGASAVVKRALAFAERSRFARLALVNGAVGVIVAPLGRLFVVLGLTVQHGKIVEIDVIADSARFRKLDLAVLN